MRKLFPIAVALLAAVSCCKVPCGDRLLSGGKTVKGIDAVVLEEAVPEFPGLTLRTVEFVNNGTKAVKVDAMESSFIEVSGKEIWSFQPSSTGWRKDWAFPIEKGFYQRNFLGMNDPDYGGGIPMVTLWTPESNLSTGIAESVIKQVSMPVTRKGNTAWACIRQDCPEPVTLEPG